MKWRGRRGSSNIEDRRRAGVGRGGQIGGLGLVIALLAGAFFGFDVTPLLQGQGGVPQIQSGSGELTQADQDAAQFVSVALADTETFWTKIFSEQLNGRRYNPGKLVLFKGVTQSACGGASGATGPFYCPGDKKIYLDTDFFTTMSRQMGAGGDFAAAYVVSHEVAHYVQDELGILGKANQRRARASRQESNLISVMIELQADCFSGVWARYAAEQLGTVERGDFAEALNAARQVGDDTIQRKAGGYVQPENFTHGSSEQRQRWFERGLRSGQIAQCDTFKAGANL